MVLGRGKEGGESKQSREGGICTEYKCISYLLPQYCCVTNTPKTQWLQTSFFIAAHSFAGRLAILLHLSPPTCLLAAGCWQLYPVGTTEPFPSRLSHWHVFLLFPQNFALFLANPDTFSWGLQVSREQGDRYKHVLQSLLVLCLQVLLAKASHMVMSKSEQTGTKSHRTVAINTRRTSAGAMNAARNNTQSPPAPLSPHIHFSKAHGKRIKTRFLPGTGGSCL
jgi:hypothetical protein